MCGGDGELGHGVGGVRHVCRRHVPDVRWSLVVRDVSGGPSLSVDIGGADAVWTGDVCGGGSEYVHVVSDGHLLQLIGGRMPVVCTWLRVHQWHARTVQSRQVRGVGGCHIVLAVSSGHILGGTRRSCVPQL